MSKLYSPLNGYSYLRSINEFHKKKQKNKYDDHLNKNLVGDIKLDYKVELNWLNELVRVKNFSHWYLLIKKKYKMELLLKEIPKEICQFVNLRELYLNNNKIKKIPKELYQLINLRRLSLSYNQIKNIPKRLYKLINLEELYLSHNKITKISDSSFPDKLIVLDLRNNAIKKIPEEIQRIINTCKHLFYQ